MSKALSSSKRLLLAICILFPPPVFAQWASDTKLSVHAMNASLNEDMGQCIAANGDTIHIVWLDRRSHGAAVYYKRSVDTGLTWNTEIPLTDTNGKASFPTIAVSGNTVHIAWLDSVFGKPASMYKRSLDGGNTWGPNICLDSNTLFWPGIAAHDSLVTLFDRK